MTGRDTRPRALVIGLDGATFDVLGPMLDTGVMPNLRRLMAEGASGALASVLPTNSPAAWSSFATGKLPSRHGIYEFRLRQDGDPYRRHIVNSTFLRAQTLWQILGRHGRRSGVIAMPMTYPPLPLDGFMVTGLLTPRDAAIFTYPADLSDELRQVHGGHYTFDVEWMSYKGREAELIRDVDRLAQVNLETTLHLAGDHRWDFLATVFVTPDRLQHCMWPYIDPAFPRYDAEGARQHYPLVQRHFTHLDACIGRLLAELADERTTVFVMSDHGFRGVYEQMVIDDWLAENGLLTYHAARRDLARVARRIARPIYRHMGKTLGLAERVRGLSRAADIDWSRTLAYCPWDQQQGIAVNLRGREPQGIVSPGAEYTQLVDRIEVLARHAQHPRSGTPLFEEVMRGKEYYRDTVERFTPDLILLAGSHLRVAAPRQARMFDPTGWATGDHAMSGILVVRGDGIRRGVTAEGARLIDLAPTILYALGIAVPDDMDGRVLEGVYETTHLQSHPPLVGGASAAGTGGQDGGLNEDEESQLEDRLRGLGYM